jgi:hypothetical protein
MGTTMLIVRPVMAFSEIADVPLVRVEKANVSVSWNL